jgi:16S rRNA (guanine527-N7)-methyltransferase
LDLSAPYFSGDTVGLYLKGRAAPTEVEAAQRHWQFSVKLHPSLTDADARIVVVRALQANTEVHSP